METPSRIAHARKLRGFSQEGLARELGVSTRTVSRMEQDGAEPTLSMLRRVAGQLDVSEAWLLTGEGRGPAPAPEHDTLRDLEPPRVA